MLSRVAAVLAVLTVALASFGYVALSSRINQLNDELGESRRIGTSIHPTPEPTDSGVKVLQTARPTDLITVISGGNAFHESEWPPCSGSTSMCVDRVIAPCDEVEFAYSYGHMMTHVRFPIFRAKRDALVSHEGKNLSAQDIVKMAKDERASFDGGPDAALDAANRGDRTRLVGDYTERGEIDVFHPAAVGLDYARCTDRESRFEVIEAQR